MSYSIEFRVRHEAAKLLREGHAGCFVCLSCLARSLQDAVGATYTPVQIEVALQAVSKTPGSLRYKHTVVREQCGKKASCLSAK